MSCARAIKPPNLELLKFEIRDGASLHASVPAHRWCVTYRDLQQFRGVVLHALRNQALVSNEYEEVRVGDEVIGPSMALVTSQLITPITKKHGSASWALMLHPDGLECDLFVTHGWKEGVFEFLSKVMYSWPIGAHNAYCCMLSNPQNLDIGNLLQHPDQSPFAQALRSARMSLVVPNASTSVYTRIWCVYEAYLSYSWEKPIYTAGRRTFPVWRPIASSAAFMALGGSLTFGYFWSGRIRFHEVYDLILIGIVSICICGTIVVESVTMLRRVNEAGAFLCGVLIGYCCEAAILHADTGSFAVVPAEAALIFWVCGGIIFGFREVDRHWTMEAETEARCLRDGYTGRLQDASASVPSDRQRILTEIQANGLEGSVEHAIGVLINAGMSTPGLRQAASHGVDVSGAGSWSLGLVGAVVLVFIAHPISHIMLETSCSGDLAWIPFGKAGLGVLWVALFKVTGPDSRGIVAAAGAALGVTPYFVVWFAWITYKFVLGDIPRQANCVPDAFGFSLWGPLMLYVSALGIGGVASLPVVGPSLTSFLLLNGVRRPTLTRRSAKMCGAVLSSLAQLRRQPSQFGQVSGLESDSDPEGGGGSDSDPELSEDSEVATPTPRWRGVRSGSTWRWFWRGPTCNLGKALRPDAETDGDEHGC